MATAYCAICNAETCSCSGRLCADCRDVNDPVCGDCRRHAHIGAAVERMESGERLAQVAGEYTVFDDGLTGAVGWHKDPADALAEIRKMKEGGK